MIERLFESERRYGEPEYSQAMARIIAAKDHLLQQLDKEGRAYVEQLTDAYVWQEGVMVRDAFWEGFCIAAGLAADVLRYLDDAEEN